MSKELPYFRFTASEWLNDDISLESFETKGVFADICAYYWFKDCSVTKALLEKRFSNCHATLKRLIETGIIKSEENNDFIEISFLNSQFDLLSESRKRRQDAGSKGGKKRSSNAKAKLKQSPSYKDKDKDNNKKIVFDFVNPEYKEAFETWIEYKKARNEKYKNQKSLEACYNKLIKLSSGNPVAALEIINNSMANNWAGLFPLKKDKTDEVPYKLKITTGAFSR